MIYVSHERDGENLWLTVRMRRWYWPFLREYKFVSLEEWYRGSYQSALSRYWRFESARLVSDDFDRKLTSLVLMREAEDAKLQREIDEPVRLKLVKP